MAFSRVCGCVYVCMCVCMCVCVCVCVCRVGRVVVMQVWFVCGWGGEPPRALVMCVCVCAALSCACLESQGM